MIEVVRLRIRGDLNSQPNIPGIVAGSLLNLNPRYAFAYSSDGSHLGHREHDDLSSERFSSSDACSFLG